MEWSTWFAFFLASWAISISPGAGAVAAMSAGLNHGVRRGYVTTVGLVLGIWTQLTVVAMGLGALVATSHTAFQAVKWAGVAYLVFLLAVLPQFLDVSATLWPQYLIMGLTLSFTDFVVMGGYMAIAAGLLRALESAAHVRLMNRVFGTLFIVAGALLSVFKRGA
ncbi:MAG: LysE family transporter [Burkholderiaceae bacterium]|nr:LysE family transporter [Burkholderiaceae bacterium]